ncbi:MAG: HAD family hydrolase [Candidatus Bathyarchaeia archaeon]
MIRVVSFDLEGTLVDMTFSDKVWNEGLPRLYALKAGVSFNEARRIVLNEYVRVGENRVEWYDICYWFRRFELSGNPQHLIDSYKGYVRLLPDAVGVLEKLSQKYRLIVVTNSNQLFVDALAQPIIRYFERAFSTTSEFGMLKKNPETYNKVCEALGVAPSEVVHVGDRLQDDFESPRSVGVNAYLLDRQDTCTCVSTQYRVRSLHEFAELLQH